MICIQCNFIVYSSQDIKIKIIVLHKNPGPLINIELINEVVLKYLLLNMFIEYS